MIGGIIALLILFLVSKWIRPAECQSPDLYRTYNLGVAFRIIGTAGYMFYAFFLTGGNVDAFVYDNWAERFAEYFLRWDFSPFTEPSLYRGGQLFYTNFVAYPAAFFLILTFNSKFGIYLLFSTACFTGLVFILKSFYRNYQYINRYRITLLTLLFPAVWFWTSTIGKDSFTFLGVGIVCLGFNRDRLNYLLIAMGVAIVYAFRPPVAYMLLFALAALFVFNIKDSLIVKMVKIGVGLYIATSLLNVISGEWGIEELDTESLIEFQQSTLRNNNYGSGVLEDKAGGLSSIPRGILDIMARPFIWEVRDITTLLASFEITFMLVILFRNRSSIKTFAKSMLYNKLSGFIGAFVIIYIISVGLFENNIGLIARHRAILFPFLFLAGYSYNVEFTRKPTRPVINRKPQLS